jgi:hypothetical protein
MTLCRCKEDWFGSQAGYCVWVEQHVYLPTVVSISWHYKNSTKRVGLVQSKYHLIECRSCRGRVRMVVGFTTTYVYAISAIHHWCCEFESWSGQGVQHYVIKLVSDLWQVGGPGPSVSSTNKTDRHNISEILLKGLFEMEIKLFMNNTIQCEWAIAFERQISNFSAIL